MKTFVLASLMLVPAAAQPQTGSTTTACANANMWANPATGETGGCFSITAKGVVNGPIFHCPWEGGSVVNAYGCAGKGPNPLAQGWAQYNCEANDVATLIRWYEKNKAKGSLFDISPAGADYVVACLKQQCRNGAPAGPTATPSAAAVAMGVPSAARRLGDVVV